MTSQPSQQQVCAVALRNTSSGMQFLALQHPHDENHVINGKVEGNETAAQAAKRLLLQTSGVKTQGHPHALGKSDGIVRGESWHFMVCNTAPLPDEWRYDSGSSDDPAPNLFWQSFDAFLEEGWEPHFIRAARHIQLKLNALPKEKLAALVPAPNSEITDTILQLLSEKESVDPAAVAIALAGKDEKQWRKLMKPIRTEALRLTKQGRTTILRKGKVVDPDNFKGVYRIGRLN